MKYTGFVPYALLRSSLLPTPYSLLPLINSIDKFTFAIGIRKRSRFENL
ncbi:hypothetical protein [Moorena sp. SIO4A5]|nr:hypothetical protein [Moorena sp. SIO4A5]NEO23666.1 hypothetical protein [Moorena sp. SIO4A5]